MYLAIGIKEVPEDKTFQMNLKGAVVGQPITLASESGCHQSLFKVYGLITKVDSNKEIIVLMKADTMGRILYDSIFVRFPEELNPQRGKMRK